MFKSTYWWYKRREKFDGFFQDAKIGGYATVSEINNLLRDENADGSEIEELLAFLDEIGIRVFDDSDDPPEL